MTDYRSIYGCRVIVDAVVADDKIPNLPHVELKRVGNYALARVKEAVLAVTGG